MSDKVPSTFPDSVKFSWAPITDPSISACGRPQQYNASEEFKGKRVVLVSVPGAFTPGCQGVHLPPFLARTEELLKKNVDLVVVIAYNDAFVMAAWGKANGATEKTKVLFMSDSVSKFSESIGWTAGERTARYAMVIETDGSISYGGKDVSGEITASSFDTVLAKL